MAGLGERFFVNGSENGIDRAMTRKAQKVKSKGRHPGGRPTKFTPEAQQTILGAIRANAYIETASALAGIDKDTFYAWLKKGARESTGRFREFSDAIKKALAVGQMRDLAVVDKAANGYDVEKTKTFIKEWVDAKGKKIGNIVETTTEKQREFAWQAAAWRLERRFPHLWGRMERPGIQDLPDGLGQDKPLMTLKRETIDIYDPDRLARLIGAFAEADIIPKEIVKRFAFPSPTEAAPDEVHA